MADETQTIGNSQESQDVKANVRRKKTQRSCDRCRLRKTKCIDPVPGPCQACRHSGISCFTDVHRKRQRPYYQVSQEQYRYMIKVLRHYIPEIEFSLPALKSLSEELDTLSKQDDEHSSDFDETPVPIRSPEQAPRKEEVEPAVPIDEELSALDEQLGCLMIDSGGKYRHVGPHSGIRFNAAVRSMTAPLTLTAKNLNIIPGMSTRQLPPKTPEASIGSPERESVHLPPRHIARQYVMRFLEEVNHLYWFYSTESLYSLLEDLYASQGSGVTASALCSFYSIFALCHCGGLGDDAGTVEDSESELKTASEYLASAKILVPRVCDEADIDSVKALCILALALQSGCFSNTAYLHVGTAVRIAFSLGLHREKTPPNSSYMEQEYNRRLWWALYVLDYDIASRFGNPCAIAHDVTGNQRQFPTEEIVGPGMYTPPGYLTALSTLTKIKRNINSVLYTEFHSSARKVSSNDIMPLLTSLNNWLSSLPPHLTNFSHVATSHKRAVAALHLRYWYAVILVTRPFLFYSALRGKSLTNANKAKLFEDLSAMNLSAVQKCMQILQQMSADRLLSNLISFDATCILEIIQLCAVRVIEKGDSASLASIKQCHDILRSMENWGWTKMVIVETTAQLIEQGVLKEEPDQDQSEPTLDTIFQTPGSISGVLDIDPPEHIFDIDFDEISTERFWRVDFPT